MRHNHFSPLLVRRIKQVLLHFAEACKPSPCEQDQRAVSHGGCSSPPARPVTSPACIKTSSCTIYCALPVMSQVTITATMLWSLSLHAASLLLDALGALVLLSRSPMWDLALGFCTWLLRFHVSARAPGSAFSLLFFQIVVSFQSLIKKKDLPLSNHVPW